MRVEFSFGSHYVDSLYHVQCTRLWNESHGGMMCGGVDRGDGDKDVISNNLFPLYVLWSLVPFLTKCYFR